MTYVIYNYKVYAGILLFLVLGGLIVFWTTNLPDSVLSVSLNQGEKPKCTCYFPDEKKYGVRDEKEGCKIFDCEKPKKNPEVIVSDVKCLQNINIEGK